MRGQFLDEFAEGQTYATAGRTVTETDLILFAGVTGDQAPIHTDEAFAKTTPFGRRLVHGMLTLSVAQGLMSRSLLLDGTAIAILGMGEIKFLAPVFIGDTLKVTQRVGSIRPSKDSSRGILVREVKVLNQEDNSVLAFEITNLVLRRPSS